MVYPISLSMDLNKSIPESSFNGLALWCLLFLEKISTWSYFKAQDAMLRWWFFSLLLDSCKDFCAQYQCQKRESLTPTLTRTLILSFTLYLLKFFHKTTISLLFSEITQIVQKPWKRPKIIFYIDCFGGAWSMLQSRPWQ